jgi:hypothetical protein
MLMSMMFPISGSNEDGRNLYEDSFEEKFVEETKRFYWNESVEFLSCNIYNNV